MISIGAHLLTKKNSFNSIKIMVNTRDFPSLFIEVDITQLFNVILLDRIYSNRSVCFDSSCDYAVSLMFKKKLFHRALSEKI